MSKEKGERKKSKSVKKKIRDILGLSADTIQIAQFVGSTLKTILAATAVVGGTVLVGKTITDQDINLFKKEVKTQEVTIQPTPTTVLGEQDISKTPTPTQVPTESVKPVINVDNGWGHPAAIFEGNPDAGGVFTGYDMTVVPFYVSIHNAGGETDYLISVASDSCQSIYYHDMTPSSSQGRDDRPINFNLEIPNNGALEMKFMGHRLVCEGASGITVGGQIKVRLFFERSSEKETLIEIRQTPD